jgi:hypothetical protein
LDKVFETVRSFEGPEQCAEWEALWFH